MGSTSVLQFMDGTEHAAFETPPGELGEESFHRVKPGCRRGSEVEGPAGMAGEPCAHLRMLVGRIVVDDGVDRLSFWDFGVDGVEEADELLMAVARHAAAGHFAFHDKSGNRARLKPECHGGNEAQG